MPTSKTSPQTDSTQAHSKAAGQESERPDKDMTAKAGEAIDGALQDASNAAREQSDKAKSLVADEISSVSSALRTAAKEMRSGSPQERTFGQIAEGLADASDALRDKDLGTMVGDVSRFARSNPMVFLGGAALIGFAATRFAKASDEGRTQMPGDYNTNPGGL